MALIPLQDAQNRVWAACPPALEVEVPVAEALGMVLAAPVVAPEAVPPFANTAMDGYAVRAADVAGADAGTEVTLDVVGTIAAGARPDPPVGPGQAVRIMTGAPIPPGADAIVMVELTETLDGGARVKVLEAVPVGNHIRPPGDDIEPGQGVFEAGEILSPGHLGVAASLGLSHLHVHPRVRVGVISTGDELVDDGGPLGPGQIRDSNRRTLLALVEQAGADPVDLGLARDDEDVIRDAFLAGAETCDAMVTSGGVSVGDFDFVKKVLDELSGGTFTWMQVAIKPAKPFAFGTITSTGGRVVPVFGLPGNAVSSMVSFEVFARPAIRRMMGFAPGRGHGGAERLVVRAITDAGLPRHQDGKLHLVRVVVSYDSDAGTYRARSAGGQASHLLRSMALANALALVPDGAGIPPGGSVDVLLTTT